jgi:predicted site-specific integrase-resolvase
LQSNQPVKVLRLKVREYAEREGVSIRTVRRWIEKEAIRVDRVGPTKRVRVRVDDEYHE